jgi:hypothetical protein
VIGGRDTQTSPMYIRLILKPYDHEFLDDKAYIEIQTENVDDFINSQDIKYLFVFLKSYYNLNLGDVDYEEVAIYFSDICLYNSFIWM